MNGRTSGLRVLMGLLALTLAAIVWAAAPAPTEQQQQEASAVVAPIPESAKKIPNPVRPTQESLDNGKLFFSSQCTMCHGVNGNGQGSLVERLKLVVPDFTDAAVQSRRTDGELFYILTNGHGKMRGEGDRLPDNVKWDLINYVRSLQVKG